MKRILFFYFCCCFALSAQAQPKLSGFVYELQSGEPLEGVRVQFKNKQGLEIGTMQAVYTDAEGYYEFTNVKPREYRAEITHTFETTDGPALLRLYNLGEMIEVDSTDYQLNIAMSSIMTERAEIYRKMVFAYTPEPGVAPDRAAVKQAYEKQNLERFGPNWQAKVNKLSAERRLLSSRMINHKGKHIDFVETANLISPQTAGY